MPDELASVLEPILAAITQLTDTIRGFDRHIAELGRTRYPETALLRQVDGVGPLVSLAFVLTLEDPGRFAKSRQVGSYLGLCPRRRQSGDKDPELSITKAGDRELRRLLVQSAQYMLGPFGSDGDLRRWGLVLAQRGRQAAKRRAVVAVARRLAVLLHRLWLTGEVYEPLRHAQRAKAA